MLYCTNKNKFLYSFIEYTIKVVRKVSSRGHTNCYTLALCKIILNIYEIPYIYDSSSSFLSLYQNL